MKSRTHKLVFCSAALIAACLAAGGADSFAQAPVLSGSEVSVSLGIFAPSGNSDLWGGNMYLTGDPSDFDGAIAGFAYAAHMNPWLDFQVGVQYYGQSSDVVYRYYYDEYGDPIDQTHRFSEVPVDFSFKFFPISRMAEQGPKGARILRPVVPYIGGGAGALFWDYSEEGWFVDDLAFPTYAYYDERSSSGIAFSAHLLAGVEFQISPWVALWVEGRYRWAEDDLEGGYGYGSQEIDLGGGSLSVGTSFRF